MSKTQFLAHKILEISVFLFPDWKLIFETQQLKWLGQKNTSNYENLEFITVWYWFRRSLRSKTLFIDYLRLLSYKRTHNWVSDILFKEFHWNPFILTWDTSVSLHGLKPIDSYVQRVKAIARVLDFLKFFFGAL